MAAASLGRLTLDLVAKIGNFTEPMTKAERHAKNASNNIADSFGIASVAAKALGVAVAGISVGGVVSFANQTVNAGNEIKKFSELANSSTRDFQYFAKGAETAGFSMEKFADVNKDVLDRLGEVSRGEGEMMDFFERIAPKIGVTAAQFKNLSGPEALQAYYNGLQKANLSHAEQVTYMEQLANDASMLIPLLKNGGEGFQKWGDAAERMNALMSDEMIANLALAKENVQLLNLQWEGAKNTLINGSMPAIQATIDNMDALTNVTMIAGAYLAGSYIPTLAIATKGLVTDTVAKISNIASTRAKTLADYEVAKANLAATAAMVRAMGVANAQTAAMMTNARAAYQQAAAAKATMFAGSGLLGVLGGPVGLGITMASVAAGYLLMKDGAEKATASIDIQGKSVADLVVKYRELNTLQRDNETKALADQVEDLGLKYRVASSDLYSFMEALPISDEKIATFTKLNSELSQGRISSNEYYEAVKNVNILTDSQLSKVRGLVGGYVEAKNKFNEAETAQDALANSMGSTTQKAKEQAAEVAGLSEEIKKLLGTNKEAMLKNTSLSAMIGAGADPKLAEYLYEARKAQGILGTSKMLSEDVRKSVLARYNSEIGLNKTLEERAKIEERNKKLIEAQGDAMKVNALVASNAAKFNFKGIEAKNGLPTGLLSAIHMQESRGNANAYNESSGATGGFQFLAATAKQYGVKDRYNLAQSAEGAGKYLAYLLKTFNGDIEKAISAYHAGEGNVQRGTNIGPINRQYVKNVKGYMGGASGVSFTEGYSYDDWLKEQEKFSIERERREKEQAAKQLDLTHAVATEKVRINTKLAQDIKSIEEAGFPESESKKLIAEYQRRADIDIQIADAAQIDKLSSFSDYTKSEEQLLNESYARRQRDLKLDISLTIGAYTEASAYIEKQRVMELSALQISQQKQLLEVKKTWMSAADYARDYYALVREEILNTAEYSPEMKEALLQQSVSQQNFEQSSERDQAISDYRDVMGYEENPLEQQFEVLQKMRELDLLNEEAYQNAKLELQAKSTAGYMEGMLGGFASLVDENSKTYAVLFAAQKAFAVAQAMLNIPAAYSKAYDAVVGTPYIGPYIAPAVGAAAAALQVAQAASIKGVGFADGGFTGYGGKYDVAGLVHRGEGVLTQEEIAALGGPAGFYALREAIKNGYADGGMVLDPPKVFTQQNSKMENYVGQVNKTQQPNVNLNPNFVIVDERESMSDYLFSPDGTKAFVKFFKRNKAALGV
ncbi:transglycosylase SLT domain-containing protein [Acinetobacter johnsonii]|uniref:transglycosylase SLT domain-containing protein n=1 Tax=Acinetobacter johnsonii TaxID=40214 RepID=UPI00244C2D1C|nr:transglycosylase SLT domain-containing protein [Acinetobacter johnsonii]MDH0836901.1 transglycosylase SLT domain-containing protein [Acinetobacter johnsonii]MDH0840116.1 transglycosylase SLT domain-containing protein [Acinetobacter johnsonii]